MKPSFIPFGLMVAVLLGAAACSSSRGTASSGSCTVSGTACRAACDANLGCVACVSNAQCTGSKPRCVLGECEACGSNADCGTGMVCFPGKSECHAPCKQNADCPSDAPICETGGVCVGCRTSGDCGNGRPVCEPVRAQCSQCASSADCSAAEPVCNVNGGTCEECLVDANCSSAEQCGGDHKCHFACHLDTDCTAADKPFCDAAHGKCVECLSNAQCPIAQPLCDGDKCVLCTSNASCTDPLHPICHATACVECVKNADCTDPARPTCRGMSCGAR